MPYCKEEDFNQFFARDINFQICAEINDVRSIFFAQPEDRARERKSVTNKSSAGYNS